MRAEERNGSARARPEAAERLLTVSIRDVAGIDPTGLHTAVALGGKVFDDATLLKSNVVFEVAETDDLSIAVYRSGAPSAPLGEVIIPVPILGPPDGPPIDRWFAVKLQDDESMVKKAAAATGRGAGAKGGLPPGARSPRSAGSGAGGPGKAAEKAWARIHVLLEYRTVGSTPTRTARGAPQSEELDGPLEDERLTVTPPTPITPADGGPGSVLEQLEAKVDRLAARKRELKAQLLSAQRKEQVFVQRMDAHMDEVERSESRLEAENAELRAECAEFAEFAAARAQAPAPKYAGALSAEGEREREPVSKLMDRLMHLVSTGEFSPHTSSNTVNAFQSDVFETLRGQMEEVRQQNRDLAIRLSDEQQLCARLHQSLCDAQQEHLLGGQRADTGGNDGDTLGRSAGAEPGLVRQRLEGEAAQEIAQLRAELAECKHRGDLGAEAEVQHLRHELAEERQTARRAASAERELARARRRNDELSDALVAQTWRVAEMSDMAPRTPPGEEAREVARGPSEEERASVALREDPPEVPAEGTAPSDVGSEDLAAMEAELWRHLDQVQFPATVLRVAPGRYQFGGTTALVRPGGEKGIEACVDGSAAFVPVGAFLEGLKEEEAPPLAPLAGPTVVQRSWEGSLRTVSPVLQGTRSPVLEVRKNGVPQRSLSAHVPWHASPTLGSFQRSPSPLGGRDVRLGATMPALVVRHMLPPGPPRPLLATSPATVTASPRPLGVPVARLPSPTPDARRVV